MGCVGFPTVSKPGIGAPKIIFILFNYYVKMEDLPEEVSPIRGALYLGPNAVKVGYSDSVITTSKSMDLRKKSCTFGKSKTILWMLLNNLVIFPFLVTSVERPIGSVR